MIKTVTWKKGMRLSAELFNAADESMMHLVRQSVLCATNGRFGLFRAPEPFEISLNITNNIAEVVSLNCHAVTKNGTLIDLQYDASYDSTSDNRVVIPANADDQCLLLLVRMNPGVLRPCNETFSEPEYTFELVGENSPIDDNCMPLAAIVNQYGWRMNELDFTPPCLTVNAHHNYTEMWQNASDKVNKLCNLCVSGRNTAALVLLNGLWRSAKAASIRLSAERELMSPEALFATIQTVVADYAIGCYMDPVMDAEMVEPFDQYANLSVNRRTLFNDIARGIALISEIVVKMDQIIAMKVEEPKPQVETKTPPRPKPQPEPDDDPEGIRKRRWFGKEI